MVSVAMGTGVIIGGMDVKAQRLVLERKPHVVIGALLLLLFLSLLLLLLLLSLYYYY